MTEILHLHIYVATMLYMKNVTEVQNYTEQQSNSETQWQINDINVHKDTTFNQNYQSD